MNDKLMTTTADSQSILISQSALLGELLVQWNNARTDGFSVSIFIIDVDKFSLLENKSACFDKILEAIRGVFHRENDFIAQFDRKKVIAITSQMSFRQAGTLATRIHKSVASLEIFHPHSATGRYATVSIGHSTYIPHSDSCYDILDILASVLKHVRNAKRTGGNCSKTRLYSQVLS